MPTVSRRQFVAAAVTSMGLVASPTLRCAAEVTHQPIPMLHVTDLFRPHNDPDDHWDLACAYSLAWQGKADLRGILIDYPQAGRGNEPDVLSVSQLNYLTGKTVPVVVGSPRWITPDAADAPENRLALRGIRSILQMLRESEEPLVISILGSCRDVAMAGSLEPALFAEKCKAIYLNAGSGTPDPEKAKKLEWNVGLDPRAYATTFTLPCPVYWMPCFEQLGSPSSALDKQPSYGTYFRFRQAEVLPHLSPELQNYFAFMFKHGHLDKKHSASHDMRPDWLSTLVGPVDSEFLQRLGAMDRNMWCTGGFLHAVGTTVTKDGEIVPIGDAADPVFTFDAVDVSCAANGVTSWRNGTASPPRYIFHVRDPKRYPTAMTRALKSLIVALNSTVR